MPRVYLSLGSNIDRESNIRKGLQALAQQFGAMVLSRVYESESVGFQGDNFLNLVAGIDTDISIGELQVAIKKIEDDNGRERSGPKFSSRTLDIDILTYGDFAGVESGVSLPRDEITKNAFVLLPLAEVAAQEIHPLENKSYALMWDEYDKSQQKLWVVNF